MQLKSDLNDENDINSDEGDQFDKLNSNKGSIEYQ